MYKLLTAISLFVLVHEEMWGQAAPRRKGFGSHDLIEMLPFIVVIGIAILLIVRRKKWMKPKTQNAIVTNEQIQTQSKNMNMTKKYLILRFFIGLIQVFAVLILSVTLLGGASFIEHSRGETNIAFGIAAMAVGLFISLMLFAVAQSAKVLIDIEENTRRTAMNTEK